MNNGNTKKKRFAKHGLNMPPPPLPISTPLGVEISPSTELDKWITHPGFGIEPQKVVRIYREAEQGWPQRQADLFEDVIENDGHLRSLIEARTLAVAGKPWQIQPGGDDPASVAAAAMLDDALNETNFDDLVCHILSCRYHGYSATEIVWKQENGATAPHWFIPVPPRRFVFDDFDRPRFLESNLVSRESATPLEPGKWVYAKNQGVMSTITARSGLMRTAAWYALFKKWSWRDWVIYAEKFGIPLVMGKFPAESTPEQKNELEAAVTDIGEAGQAIMPEEMQVTIHEAQQGGDSTNLHRSIVKEANNEISKLITGSTLTVETGGPGSFALGKVHETRSFDLVISDADLVADRFQMDIARPFLRFNGFGPNVKLPSLKIHLTRESDPLTRATLAGKLVDMGLSIDSEQLRDEFQFRAPPTEDRAIRRVEGSQSTSQMQEDQGNDE